MNIGIFGGSFNPIHTGHIALARELLTAARLDEIWFMVTPLNPFKVHSPDLLPDHQRLNLVRLALAREPHLSASDLEFRLPKPSYSWQTLQTLQSKHPDHHFTLLIGADNWLAFDRWRNSRDILQHFPIVVYPRDGYPVDPATLPAGVTLVDTPLHPVSSTMIRQRIARGDSLRGLVPHGLIGLTRRYFTRQHSSRRDNS